MDEGIIVDQGVQADADEAVVAIVQDGDVDLVGCQGKGQVCVDDIEVGEVSAYDLAVNDGMVVDSVGGKS